MAALLHYLGTLAGTLGIFLGFYHLGANPGQAIRVVAFWAVGVVGTLAFLRHLLFHRADARRRGWETDRPDWAYEVGFVNLAFGVLGLGAFGDPRSALVAAWVTLGYAAYLLQAALLHGYRFVTQRPRDPARLWRSCVSTLLFAGLMAYFALGALRS